MMRWKMTAATAATVVIATGCGSGLSPASSGTPGPGIPQPPAGSSAEIVLASQHLDLAAVKPAPIQPDGSIGTNKAQWHTVGEQRRISPTLMIGLVREDTTTVATAVTSMEYTLSHENTDGSFQVVDFAGQPALPTFDPVGTSFFYADLGHSLELLNGSAWFQQSSVTAPLRARVAALRPRVAAGLDWLLGPTQMAALDQTGVAGTNRWTFGANALILTGQWLGDQAAVDAGLQILRMILSAETPDGVLPESHAFDSSYQGVSLLNLAYLDYDLSQANAAMKPAVGDALNRGVDRERQAIQSDGTIVTAGSSRVFCGGESFRGTPKGGEYRDIVIGFLYDSQLRGDASLLGIAQTVTSRYIGSKKGPAAC